jgi:hypothetical protein
MVGVKPAAYRRTAAGCIGAEARSSPGRIEHTIDSIRADIMPDGKCGYAGRGLLL